MKPIKLFLLAALALAGACGDDLPAEVIKCGQNAGLSYCRSPRGICYLGVPGYAPGCTCNGESDNATAKLCAELKK